MAVYPRAELLDGLDDPQQSLLRANLENPSEFPVFWIGACTHTRIENHPIGV